MDRRGPAAFVAWGLGAALPAAGILLAVGGTTWPGGLTAGWALAGWAATTAIGLAGGAWLTMLHGNPSPAFVVALLACMLSRFGAGLAGALTALVVGGRGAAWAWIAGLAGGYVPLQLFEAMWFIRRRPPQAG